MSRLLLFSAAGGTSPGIYAGVSNPFNDQQGRLRSLPNFRSEKTRKRASQNIDAQRDRNPAVNDGAITATRK